jgi:hypothetical protein
VLVEVGAQVMQVIAMVGQEEVELVGVDILALAMEVEVMVRQIQDQAVAVWVQDQELVGMAVLVW